jgi:uncharacterized repeat protein (TIGR03803 family)
MAVTRWLHSVGGVLLIFAAAALVVSTAGAAGTTQVNVIYSFAGGNDGAYTDTDLVADSAGNLYGTSVEEGKFGGGTVFQVTSSGVHTVLYNFTGGADGGEPYKGVTLDPAGNLYGTAVTGGTGAGCDGGCGVVYKLTNSGGTWVQSVLHNFTGGNDGSGPGSGLTFDKQGNLYGTTPTGGAKGFGVIYQLKPSGSGNWKLSVIHTFTGGADGLGGSAGRLILDAAGNLYGTCTVGGVNGSGTVYELSFRQGQWHLTTLYAFKDQPDGALPYGGLIFDRAGNLYGTTYYAGANDLGTVYKLTHSNGTWTETVLYSFKGGADGDDPISTLVSDAAGNLYGTTSDGGAKSCNCGTIFKMTRGSGGTWTESVAYQFLGSPDAGFAYNGMVVDRAGNFYGATVHGGTVNDGAIYQFTP